MKAQGISLVTHYPQVWRNTCSRGHRRAMRHFSTRGGLAQQTDDGLRFPGALEAKFTTSLAFENPREKEVIPCYRVMDSEGVIVDKSYTRDFSDETAIELYTNMVKVSLIDMIGLDSQRQGRISFYMNNSGEEGVGVGSASAISPGDVAFPQYRELGLFIQRGFTFADVMSQLFANAQDPGRGRNMPVHYGSRKLNIHTISSPLATQLPQAAGAAYALKMKHLTNPATTPRQCAVAYFGEGAASEGDFHAALNMAATRRCPVLYICRNNGYAISTPTLEQYRGDGIASRGAGYGIDTIRVDGNDIFAVRTATQRARQLSLDLDKRNQPNSPTGPEATVDMKPILIEAMSYRVSHHSTSDDSFAYRARVEVEHWKRHDNPITRFRKYLERTGLWDEARDADLRATLRRDLLHAFAAADKARKPPLRCMFDDVYAELTPALRAQRAELRDLLERYPNEYEVGEFEGGVEGLVRKA